MVDAFSLISDAFSLIMFTDRRALFREMLFSQIENYPALYHFSDIDLISF